MKTRTIEVGGMRTAWSSHHLEQQIGALPGVYSVTVNYAGGNATVRFDQTQVTIADLMTAVQRCGYSSCGLWQGTPAPHADAATEHHGAPLAATSCPPR